MYQKILLEIEAVIQEAKDKLSVSTYDLAGIRELQGYIRGLKEIQTICEKVVETDEKSD